LLASCKTPEPTLIGLIEKEDIVQNVISVDTDNDQQNDMLFIELYRHNTFHKVLVFDRLGRYKGQIYKQDLLWVYEDRNNNKHFIDNLLQIP
jgi:hypothetical protein